MNVIEEVYSFYENFDGEKGYIGQSEKGKLIPYFRVGNGKTTAIIQYCIHAREYITAYLALEHVKYYSAVGIDASVYFIPLSNPDGVEIALNGNPLYKANANGVDLNVNFDARWGTGLHNKKTVGSSDYIGEFPFSASESRALRDFTCKIKPNLTISYHAKGEEIYFCFHQRENLNRDKFIADAVAKITGYKIVNPIGSAGGYKDWCIEKLKIPALTIEVGSDAFVHPIRKEKLPEILQKNVEVPRVAVNAYNEYASNGERYGR